MSFSHKQHIITPLIVTFHSGENNWLLHEHMVEVAGQSYLGAARSLNSTTAQLTKSHGVVQVCWYFHVLI